MAIGSGLGSQFGFVNESTYGTRVAATKFLRAKSYSANRVSTEVQGEGIQTGNFGDLAAHYGETTNAGAGSVAFDVQTRTMGLLLQQIMGGTVTPTLLSGSAYSATFPLADTLGKSLTVQVGAPYRSGTVVVHELAGVKIPSAEFSCGVGEYLTCSLDFDAKSWSDSQTLATASYVGTDVPFHFAHMNLKIGTFGAEAAVTGVRSVNMKIDRPHDTEDYNAGSAGSKSEPVLNGATQITGTVSADWLNKATFQDRANSTASTSMVWEFVQTTAISGANFPTFRITLPGTIFTQNTQGVDGRSELTNDWNFRWSYDGTNQPTIYTVSADTTL